MIIINEKHKVVVMDSIHDIEVGRIFLTRTPMRFHPAITKPIMPFSQIGFIRVSPYTAMLLTNILDNSNFEFLYDSKKIIFRGGSRSFIQVFFKVKDEE